MLNMRAIISDKAIIALLSLGAMIPMAAGRIDLTVGYGIVLWHILAISLQTMLGLPWPIAVVVVLMLGAFTGFLNGMLVEVARIDSFIATLGTGTVLYALALWHTGGRQMVGVLPDGFYALSTTFVFGLPIVACLAVVTKRPVVHFCAGEDPGHGVVVFRRDRIVLMVVTASATYCKPL